MVTAVEELPDARKRPLCGFADPPYRLMTRGGDLAAPLPPEDGVDWNACPFRDGSQRRSRRATGSARGDIGAAMQTRFRTDCLSLLLVFNRATRLIGFGR
jgi:hypothetical protein